MTDDGRVIPFSPPSHLQLPWCLHALLPSVCVKPAIVHELPERHLERHLDRGRAVVAEEDAGGPPGANRPEQAPSQGDGRLCDGGGAA